jgi:hypothetical protein
MTTGRDRRWQGAPLGPRGALGLLLLLRNQRPESCPRARGPLSSSSPRRSRSSAGRDSPSAAADVHSLQLRCRCPGPVPSDPRSPTPLPRHRPSRLRLPPLRTRATEGRVQRTPPVLRPRRRRAPRLWRTGPPPLRLRPPQRPPRLPGEPHPPVRIRRCSPMSQHPMRSCESRSRSRRPTRSWGFGSLARRARGHASSASTPTASPRRQRTSQWATSSSR